MCSEPKCLEPSVELESLELYASFPQSFARNLLYSDDARRHCRPGTKQPGHAEPRLRRTANARPEHRAIATTGGPASGYGSFHGDSADRRAAKNGGAAAKSAPRPAEVRPEKVR